VTKVKSVSGKAGVECPKRSGKMDYDKSCRECDNYSMCVGAIMGVLV